MLTIRRLTIVALFAALLGVHAGAEEGMWTFDHPPTAAIQQKYGFAVTPDWLEHLRLSSVRFNDGGSGSLVSADGLVLTNHHVALGQLQKLSTEQRDYVSNGFSAASRGDEIKATDLELNVLISYEDVTARIAEATTRTANSQAALEARRAAIAQIEKESLDKTGLRPNSRWPSSAATRTTSLSPATISTSRCFASTRTTRQSARRTS
jgi:hypothetical protein